jgi:serine protease AprX
VRRLAVVAAVGSLAVTQAAEAAAPRWQVERLREGTAIVQFEGVRSGVQSRLRGLGLSVRTLDTFRMAAVTGTRTELRRAARLRRVTAAHMNLRLQFFLDKSVPLVYGGTQASAWAAGIDGRGVQVAVVDSGVNGLHPDLAGNVVKNFKVAGPAVAECPAPCDSDTTSGHGTHVAGIVAGDGTASSGRFTGVAPGADLIGYSVGEGINILFATQALEHIYAHPELGIDVVNNSWGSSEGRFDSTNPVNVATRKLVEQRGVTVVFASGNSGWGSRREEGHEGGSDCSTVAAEGGREPGGGSCTINPYSVAPWVLSIANTSKDAAGGPGDQTLNWTSSRGDPLPQVALTGETIEYEPTLSAPGTNIWAAKDQTSALSAACGASADPPACLEEGPEVQAFYVAQTGTSMSAPHVAGAVAVIQSRAATALGRALTPAEVREVLTTTAAPMTKPDLMYNWPCGEQFFVDCGSRLDSDGLVMTGQPYQDWQVGSGALDLKATLARIDAMAQPVEPEPGKKPKKPKKPR